MVDKFYVWIEPMQGLITVSVETYQKLVDLKIWGDPEQLVTLSKKRRPLLLREIDPFPDMDKYFTHAWNLIRKH